MEHHNKQGKPRNKILKLLPKAASGMVVYLHNRPYSPTEAAAKLKAHCRKGFSGPLMIPDQARRKSKSDGAQEEEEDEPTSPKVSCMGQIKHKKKQIKKIKRAKNSLAHNDPKPKPKPAEVIKKQGFAIRKMFSGVNPAAARKSDSNIKDVRDRKELTTLPDRAPSLSQMKRFSSGRGNAFANFDSFNVCDYDDGDEDEDEDEVRITFSAPLRVGGGDFHDRHQVVPLQPRKEINLWKRRTMAPPCPLELKPPMVRAN